MKDIRKPLYERYYADFKKGEKREKFGALHLRLWYNEKYLPLLKNIPRNAPVLELGCGSGLMLDYLLHAGFTNLTGIDISGDQVAAAVRNGFTAIEADALRFLPEHKTAYDVIIAMDVIEHFKKEELLELLEAIRQSLRPGGLFIIQTPNGEGLMPNYVIYGDLTHFTILSPLSLRQVLTFAGFVDVNMKELGPGALVHFPLFVVWQLVRLAAILIKFVEIGRIQKYWTESFICWCRRPATE
jgi:2-polyprenyl-3-methyl-5-hydroxy-6-metoxy-1,4-benzoquinol methylase